MIVDEKFVKEGIEVSSTDIKEGVIFEKGGVSVTAFHVDHRPIEPAFGYRVNYAGRSVAMSGDDPVGSTLLSPQKRKTGAENPADTAKNSRSVNTSHRRSHGRGDCFAVSCPIEVGPQPTAQS